MFGYVCFYKGKRIEVRALRSIDARDQACILFQKGQRNKVKPYDVHVVLAERQDGTSVTRSTGEV